MIRLSLPDRPLRLALVAAHPDDVEIGCGGLLLDLAERGALGEVEVLVATSTSDREAEALSSLAAFCAPSVPRITWGRLPDGRLPAHWDAVKTLLADVARRGADVVVAPSPADLHQDHRLLGELVRTEFRDHLVLHYEIPKWDGDLGATHPVLYWPLTALQVARKWTLLHEHHRSQRSKDWFREDTFAALARLRGMECRAAYAEAFACPAMALGLP